MWTHLSKCLRPRCRCFVHGLIATSFSALGLTAAVAAGVHANTGTVAFSESVFAASPGDLGAATGGCANRYKFGKLGGAWAVVPTADGEMMTAVHPPKLKTASPDLLQMRVGGVGFWVVMTDPNDPTSIEQVVWPGGKLVATSSAAYIPSPYLRRFALRSDVGIVKYEATADAAWSKSDSAPERHRRIRFNAAMLPIKDIGAIVAIAVFIPDTN